MQEQKMARKWRENGGLQMFIDSFLYFNYTHHFFYLFHSFFSLFPSLFFFLLKKKGDFSTLDKIRRCEGKFSVRGFLVANSPPYYFFFLFFCSSREFHVHATSLLSFCAQRSDAPVRPCLLFLEILRMRLLLVSLCT